MSSWFLSSACKAALTDIYVYTQKSWGHAQADAYLDGLFTLFERIAARRELWRPIPPGFEVNGYFTRYERHFVYWKVFDDGEIGFAAILHVSMMQGDRLKNDFALIDRG